MKLFNQRRLSSNQRGMTLLEIMIVLVILGGLVAVLATQVNSRLKKAKMNQAKIQIAELGKALDMFYSECNNYPTAEEGLQALVTQPSSCSNWGPEPYIKKVNKDPWGGEFIYESSGNTYLLKSLGADKREGGSGQDADISSDQ